MPTVVVNMEMTPRRQVDWLLSMTFDLQTPGRDIEEVLRMGEDERHVWKVGSPAIDGLDASPD